MIYWNDWNILCIGIDNYIIGAEPLSFCVRQAKENFEALKETTSGKHQLLLNPTSADLRQAVNTFIESSQSCRRNLLSFSGHGYEHSGQLHLKSPDSDTFSADVSVDDIREKLPEGSLFVCFLGCCRVDVTRAIETPRMLLITPVRDSVRTYLRRKLRMLTPVSREHFYLYVALNGEEVADSVGPAASFAGIIRRQPGSSIEEVARQLRTRSTHVEWRSNLDRWSGRPLGQAPPRRFHGFRVMLALWVVCCILGGCSMWLQLAEQFDYPLQTVAQLAQDTHFCDGPYFRLGTLDVSRAEEVLIASEDDVSKICLAHLYMHMDKHKNARNISGPLCSSSASDLAAALACALECRFRGEEYTSGCSRYSLETQRIACTRDPESLACHWSKLSAILDEANEAWAKIARSKATQYDPHILQTLAAFAKSSLPEEFRIVSALVLVDSEQSIGNYTATLPWLADLDPLVERVVALPLMKHIYFIYCFAHMVAWLHAGSEEKARNWFFRALEFGANDLDRSRVFLGWGNSLLRSKVDEAIHSVLWGMDLMRKRDDFWRMPTCRDQADATHGWVPAINSSCLEEELMGIPFLFDEEEARFIANAPEVHKFYLAQSEVHP